jgi:hypothetical protein
MTPDPLDRIRRHLAMLEQKWAALEDRVAVLEENTSSWDCRIEELEEWQEEVKDIIESY